MKIMTLVYLASPYGAGLNNEAFDRFDRHRIREERMELALKETIRLLRSGLNVYSPIVYNWPIQNEESVKSSEDSLLHTWEFWKPRDLDMLGRCDELYVLTIPQWRDSIGVGEEIAFATRHQKPIWYVGPDIPEFQKERK